MSYAISFNAIAMSLLSKGKKKKKKENMTKYKKENKDDQNKALYYSVILIDI